MTATTRHSFTVRMGANCVCDAPNVAEEDSLRALNGAATTAAEAIAVAVAMIDVGDEEK